MMGCSGRSIASPAGSFAGWRLVAAVALTLGAAGAARAQSVPGVIRGVVTDSAEEPLQDARVLILGTQRAALTDVTGAFTFDTVQPGQYRVRVSRVGFTPQIDSVVVPPGATIAKRFALREQRQQGEIVVAPWIPPDDTQPTFALLIDPVARVARLPRMRPIPDHWKQRELRLWVGFGHTYPMQLVRMTVSERGVVSGELWHWVSAGLPDSGQPPEVRAWSDSVAVQLRRQFRCGSFRADTLQNETGPGDQLVVACRVRFRTPPDWTSLLQLLEAVGVWTLPDQSRVPHTRPHFDGVGLVVETWNGQRYRTYYHSNPEMQPSAEARQAAAILAQVTQLARPDHSPKR